MLLSLCWLQALNVRFWGANSTVGQLMAALLFGGTSVFGMLTPITLADGLILDARSVILSMAALFSGPLVAGVAGAIASGFRVWLGGVGMWSGLAEILLSVGLGLVYRRLYLRRRVGVGVSQLLAFGLILQVLGLLLYSLLPSEYVAFALQQVGVPVLLVMPVATLLLGLMLKEILQRTDDERELRIAAIAFNSLNGMLITDASNRILRVNEAFCAITGYSRAEVIGQKTSLLSSGRQSQAFYQAMWQQLKETDSWHGEVWNRRKNGEVFPEWLSINAVRNAQWQVINYVASFADVSERQAAQEHIERLAFFDPLTGLPNRRLLLDRLQHAMATSVRSAQSSALMFLDLDNFKNINDFHGHQAGDELLRLAAERLTGAVRSSDTVARLGGDEFVVMLEGLAGPPEAVAAQAEHVAEQLLRAVGAPYRIGPLTLRSSTSIGVVLFSDDACPVEELMKRADLSMYAAKAAGKNAVRFFDPRMQEAVSKRLRLEEEIREGLQTNGFILYLQPQLDGKGGLIGAEALARWQHPQRGLLSPVAFIEVAEQAGLIDELDLQMLKQTCRQLALWRNHPQAESLSLSVNVSARFLYQADFVERLVLLLEQSGANPQRLKLELTETLLLDDLPGAVIRMNALKALGIRFSIDDFGTGYSSLAYLQRLPLDQLKIDQSFVKALPEDGNSASIIRAICALASSLKLEVIAEGVETDEQYRALLGMGCQSFQGYLFGRPMPVEELERLMAAGVEGECRVLAPCAAVPLICAE